MADATTDPIDVVVRRIPGHDWVRLFASLSPAFEPGHAGLYAGIVRRDAWRIGRVGFGIMRMPKEKGDGRG